MRVQLWLTPILGMLLTVCGRQELKAQYAPFPPGGQLPPGAQMMAPGMSPPVRHAHAEKKRGKPAERGTLLSAFKQNDPAPEPRRLGPGGPGGIAPAGFSSAANNPFAAGMMPHPAISPFENRFDQTSLEDGLWTRYVNNDRRIYKFDLEWLHGRLRRPVSRPIGTVNQNGNFARRTDSFSAMALTLQRGIVTTGQISDGERVFTTAFKSEGIRGQWGYQEPDGSQVHFEGWWLPDVSYDFIPIHRGPISVSTLNGPDPDMNGAEILFNGGVRLNYQTEAYGSSAEYAFTPWKRGKYYAIRPLVAMKYLNIQEEFSFFGRAFDMFDARLFNSTESHLVGPEAGITWELGGDFLKLYGESKFGVLYNREKIALSGSGWGVAALPFAEKRYVSHVSPSYEASLVAEIKLFQFVPLLYKYQFFKHAVVRMGGTYVAAYEVARPNDTVIYQEAPSHPTIKHNRTKWHAQWFNMGITWRY